MSMSDCYIVVEKETAYEGTATSLRAVLVSDDPDQIERYVRDRYPARPGHEFTVKVMPVLELTPDLLEAAGKRRRQEDADRARREHERETDHLQRVVDRSQTQLDQARERLARHQSV